MPRTPDASTFESDFKDMIERNAKTVYVKDGQIVFNLQGEYAIDLKRCNSPEKILGWVHHLCEKTWITPAAIRLFISHAESENGIKHAYDL